ncbi:poly-gamma-glutamate hydrolase family protein [Streptomyces alboflavus]|uniref:poly-gamma-glutamate hydrolase family protein n=1 Tax=Streptomyces alboflavus TaxID=67267 RepID=UPI00369BBB1D
MADKYNSWQELISDRDPVTGDLVNQEGRDWYIKERPGDAAGGYLTHMAIHGGGMEAPPEQLADYASTGAPFYTLAAIKARNNAELHITSTRYDEPRALAHAANAGRIVSWHGHADRTPGKAVTYVGGLDSELGTLIERRLAAAGFLCEPPPAGLDGYSPDNICNKNRIGKGVQLEMSRTLRQSFFRDGDISVPAIQKPENRTTAFYRYVEAVKAGIRDLSGGSTGDVRFDLDGTPEPVLGDTGVVLDQTRVHQQHDFEEQTQTIYATQVIANGVKLADETAPPPTGVRDSRGDLALNRVSLAGEKTGVMYVRAFDHGGGLGVEREGDTTYLWLAYDAEMQPIGTNAHGRKLIRLPFKDGDIVDVGRPGLDVYDPIPNATSITPGLDLVHGRMGIAYNTGSGPTRYEVHDLKQFRARNFDEPLYEFVRPSYPGLQSWCLYGNYVYQVHGSAYSESNPRPPDGQGDAYWTVIDIRTGRVVERKFFTRQLDMQFRELESVNVWQTAAGPRLVYGWAASDTPPRLMVLYAIAAQISTRVVIDAYVVDDPLSGVQISVEVQDPDTVQSWIVERLVGGLTQVIAAGEGSPGGGRDFFDAGPPSCVPIRYRMTVQRLDGTVESATTPEITYVPPGGCGSPEVVGEETGTLGCVGRYTAVIHWRGGAQEYESSSTSALTKVSWGRTANDTSEASVTLVQTALDPACCRALFDAHPWVHELTLYRDSELVWQGPIIRTTRARPSGLITIDAQDVTAWFEKVVNTFRVTYTKTKPDARGRKKASVAYLAWNHLRLNLVESTLSKPPDWCGIMPYVVRRESKNVITWEKDGSSNKTVWTAYLSTLIEELVKRGLAYTTVGRRLILRELPDFDSQPQARFAADDFAGDIEIIRDGASAATYCFATSQQTQDVSKGRTLGYGKTGTAYGRLDRLVEVAGDEDGKVADATLRALAKVGIWGRGQVPLTVSLPQGSTLTPTAPVTINQLVPLERFDLLVDDCTPVEAAFALGDLSVTWEEGQGEKVACSFIPLSDVEGELGGGDE